jgi:hypothetical protein
LRSVGNAQQRGGQTLDHAVEIAQRAETADLAARRLRLDHVISSPVNGLRPCAPRSPLLHRAAGFINPFEVELADALAEVRKRWS